MFQNKQQLIHIDFVYQIYNHIRKSIFIYFVLFRKLQRTSRCRTSWLCSLFFTPITAKDRLFNRVEKTPV